MQRNEASRLHCPRIKFFHKLYACEPMFQLAKDLQVANPNRFGDAICVQVETFPDGNQKLTVPCPDLDGENVIYLASYYHNDDRKLLDHRIMQFLSERGALHLTVVVPFFGSGTNERAETGIKDGVPFETVAIAALDAKAFGILGNGNTRVRLLVYDLHTLANRFYFPPSVSVVMETTVTFALSKIEFDLIVYPDNGAASRFASYWPEYTYFYKERQDDRRTLRARDSDKIVGKRVLIVDDLTRSGGTIAECAKACREIGASSVQAFVAHVVFPNNEEKAFEEGKFVGLLDKFWTTDSLPHVAARLGSLFQVLKFADILHGSL